MPLEQEALAPMPDVVSEAQAALQAAPRLREAMEKLAPLHEMPDADAQTPDASAEDV